MRLGAGAYKFDRRIDPRREVGVEFERSHWGYGFSVKLWWFVFYIDFLRKIDYGPPVDDDWPV